MRLCIDVGNTQLYCGILDNNQIKHTCRFPTRTDLTSDELGISLTNFFKSHNVPLNALEAIGFSSVVPAIDQALIDACLEYFKLNPFIVGVGIKTGLKICVNNPASVGADRIVSMVAATQQFPNRAIMIFDLGTATTFDVITAQKEYIGGAILLGLQSSMTFLAKAAAKLSPVRIVRPERTIGRSTSEQIQIGLYQTQAATIRHLVEQAAIEQFNGEKPMVIGTGGLAKLFEHEQLFDLIIPDLPLIGLNALIDLNNNE